MSGLQAGPSIARERLFKNDFALALYGLLRERQGNLFFSPFSIRTALGIACAGARGETAAEMGQTLGFAASDEALHAAVAALIDRLNLAGAGQYEMAVANSLWSQDGAPLRAEFLDLVARYYTGGMNLVDFRRDPESACALINRWVEEKTRQKVRDLIPQNVIRAETRLVLANAVYFKGLWELPFDESATRDQPFHLEGGRKVSAPLMQDMVSVRYMQAVGYQAVDLDYRGGDLSMLVVLPDRKVRLRDFEESVSVGMLESCIAQLRSREVELYLPRFKMTWDVELGSPLSSLGMALAFTRRADFSGINGYQPPHEDSLFISGVFHKAFVEVNEKGTEAAAATAVVMEALMALGPSKPPPIPVFRADHPFLFAIRDRKSGAILFLGRIADPTRDS